MTNFEECYRKAKEFVASYRKGAPIGFKHEPRCDRQGFFGGPYIDPPIANLSTLTATTKEALWTGATYTPIFANDPKAGKIYHVRAGGTISLTGGTAIITPELASAVTLGVSLTQGTTTFTIAAWHLQFDLVVRTVGSAGTCIGTGFIALPGGVTSGTGLGQIIPFGGTSATLDTTANNAVTINKTLSTTNSVITQYAYIYSPN